MKIKFKAYYDTRRFSILDPEIRSKENIEYCGGEALRKTACFLGDKFNVFIDSSDGVNEDLPINEYCGKVEFIKRRTDKPFLYFKCLFSKERSSDIVDAAESIGGKVLPYFMWNLHSQNPMFYREILSNQKDWIKLNKHSEKTSDLLYAASSKSYKYPKPSKENPKISWQDAALFGFESEKSQGYYNLETRKNIRDTLVSFSSFKTKVIEKNLNYVDYMMSVANSKMQFCPAGMGEYTCRIFNSAAIGNAPLLRKTSYDFYDSWKESFPELDLKENVEDQIHSLLSEYDVWGQKALDYYQKSLTPKRLIEVFEKEITIFHDEL